MIFNGEGIHLTAADRAALEYGGDPSFSWRQVRWLHRTVFEMFSAEAKCEFEFWDNTRSMEDSFHFAFMSEALPQFTTERLGQMAVSLQSIVRAQ
jgi:hypothetical protein